MGRGLVDGVGSHSRTLHQPLRLPVLLGGPIINSIGGYSREQCRRLLGQLLSQVSVSALWWSLSPASSPLHRGLHTGVLDISTCCTLMEFLREALIGL